MAKDLKKNILKYLKELQGLQVDELVQKRYEKFRNMGEYKTLEK